MNVADNRLDEAQNRDDQQTSQAPTASYFRNQGRRLTPHATVQFDDTLAAGLTMIFPTMYGWIVQIYGYSPGDAKV